MTKKKKAALGLLLCAGLGFVVMAAWHYQARRELEKYKATLVAQGEFMSLTQAWPKPLRGDPQKATKFFSAASQWRKGAVLDSNQVPSMRQVAFGRAMAGSLRPEICNNSENRTNSWEDLARELEANQEVIKQLRECLDGSVMDFNLAYSAGFNVLLPHLAPGKATAHKLWMATALALHKRDLPAAETNLTMLLNLSQALQQDRLIISELVRIAIAHIASAATWEALQHPGWSDAQLQALQAKWLTLQFLESMRDSFRMERAMGSESMEDMREYPLKFAAAFSPMPGLGAAGTKSTLDFLKTDLPQATKMKLTHLIWHCFWSFQDELRALQIYQSQMKALSAEHRSWTLVDSELRKELKKIGIVEQTHHGETMGYPDVLDPQLKTFFSDTVIGGNRAIRRAFVAETLREMTATAIALQRFQMRHGNYPSNLSQLVPEFLPKLPIDYMDGQMLRYRLEADSTFTLYSIGNDGIDGNGSAPPRKEDARRSWLTQPDWVWPRLASPAEIQEYEAAQAAKNARKGARRSVRQKPATTNITNSVNQ